MSELHIHHSLSPEADTFLQAIVAASPDGLALIEQSSMKARLLNQTAVELLNAPAYHLMNSPLPILLTTDQRQEICIIREGQDPTYLDVRKTQLEWQGQGYWLLALRDVTSRVQMRQKLMSESFIDDLTGLYNRRGMNSFGEQALHLAQRENRDLLFIFIDVDKMKQINDKYGHKAGDTALQDVSQLLRQTFRKSDILVRLGGDEFAVIAQGKTRQDSDRIRRRLCESIHAHNEKRIRKFDISLSVGFAHYDVESKQSLYDLLELADADMYQDKRGKKNIAS